MADVGPLNEKSQLALELPEAIGKNYSCPNPFMRRECHAFIVSNVFPDPLSTDRRSSDRILGTAHVGFFCDMRRMNLRISAPIPGRPTLPPREHFSTVFASILLSEIGAVEGMPTWWRCCSSLKTEIHSPLDMVGTLR